MGVDCTLFRELVEFSTRFQVPEGGRSLMLGRQSFAIQTAFRFKYDEALKDSGYDDNRFAFLQEDGYAETLFELLGLGSIETMDVSDFEGAGVLHDLNMPVPKKLHGKFDFIFDGGTIEHVFDAPQALRNVFQMLKPGGRFVSANGMNGWVGHGMWQFNPETVWTFWKRQAGCEVMRCVGLNKLADDWRLDFPDPAETGTRLKLRGKIPEGRIYLYYEVAKPKGAKLAAGPALQSDYQVKWDAHASAQGATA